MNERTIVIDLFDGAEELDVIGPWEVFSYWTRTWPEDGWRVHLASDDGAPRVCAKGLTLTPTTAAAGAPQIDVFVEPGGIGSRTRLTEGDHLARLRELDARGCLMASVCTGSLVYAAAGLLAGRPATTYHGSVDTLVALEPTVRLREGARWVDDGNVVTAAGVSAGIDMALHLVGRLSTPGRGRQVQDGIEYHPQPPIWRIG